MTKAKYKHKIKFVFLFLKLMSKSIYILLIAVFGFALIPNLATACSVKTEKSCCKTEKTNSVEKDCCKKSDVHSNKKTDCSGKCGGDSCLPSASHVSVLSAIYPENTYAIFNFAAEKQSFAIVTAEPTSGFYSIWTPPNLV